MRFLATSFWDRALVIWVPLLLMAVVATNAVHYATPRDYPLATADAAVRARRSLDDLDAVRAADEQGDAEEKRRACAVVHGPAIRHAPSAPSWGR